MIELKDYQKLRMTPKANLQATITKKGMRLTVLTDGLLRIEKSKDNNFVDDATQTVINRDLPLVEFSVEEKGNRLFVKTKRCVFELNLVTCKCVAVCFGDKKVHCDNRQNLKGTTRTLDGAFSAKSLENGVLSKNGVAVLFDSKSLIINNDGYLEKRKTQEKDMYIFAFLNDYLGAIDALYKITGAPPLLPRFVFGNWWSRYKKYSQDEYIALMDEFAEKKIPLTVATVDMDWHWVDVVKQFGKEYKLPFGQNSGWTGYSFNTDLFYDYKKFLAELKARSLHTTFNLHPKDGVRAFEDAYEKMALAMNIDPKTKQTIPFQLSKPEFIKAYFEVLHNPLEDDGVDFWWIDWQQGKSSELLGLDPLWALNHYHYLDNSRNKRPVILSRYAGVGSHRYPLGFSGDTFINWRILQFIPYFTATASNIGFSYWSHDIGGHMFGIRDEELYLRWLQFGAFSPINRLHSTATDLLNKEPWKYRRDIAQYATEILNLRHRMIPFIYSLSFKTTLNSMPLIQPMYYSYPQHKSAYKANNQYFFGNLMVAPITEKTDKKQNLASAKVWFPQGRFTNIFNGKIYRGDKSMNVFCDLAEMPVFAPEGTIVPLLKDEKCNFNSCESLEILVYRGNGGFCLYEDNGEKDVDLQDLLTTNLTVKENGDQIEFVIHKSVGDKSLARNRNWDIVFKDVKSARVQIDNRNEKDIKIVKDDDTYANIASKGQLEEKIFVCEGKDFAIKNIQFNSADGVIIHLIGTQVKTNESEEKFAENVISRMQGSNQAKTRKYKKMQKAKTANNFFATTKKVFHRKKDVDAISEIYLANK